MILGIDIGGTSVKLALVSERGEVLQREEASTSFDGYETPVLDTVVLAAKAFLQKTGAKPTGIGVSATGQVDTQSGVVIGTNGKIPHYEGSPIKARLESEFHLPTAVLNDANAAALGECFTGAGKGYKDVLMVTLGTGVGGGIVSGGKILGGARGIAGEIGHFTLYADGIPCPCGKTGCFESYAATTALVRMAQEATGGQNLNGRLIFERVSQGDTVLQEALARWIGDIAQGITGLVHILNPELVIIGGGVSAQEELLMKPLRQKILAQLMPRFRESLKITAASLGNDAGVVGAAKYLMDENQMN